MFKKFAGVLVGALAVASLTGCATEVVSAKPTPVDYKACMLSSVGGFSDGGINQSSYYALQQAKVQYGIRISQAETTATDTKQKLQSLVNRLVSRQCNLIFGVGSSVEDALFNAAQANPNVEFVQLDARGELSAPVQPDNLTRIGFDTDLAFFQAGYLAAEKSKTKVVGIVGASDSALAKRAIWYFRQGVLHYGRETKNHVDLVGAQSTLINSWRLISSSASGQWVKDNAALLTSMSADVILPIGVNGLAAAQEAMRTPGVSVIGSDSDWYLQPRYETVKQVILASVQKLAGDEVLKAIVSHLPNVASGSEVDASATDEASPSPTATVAPASQLVPGSVVITPAHEVSYPNATESTLADLAKSVQNGTIVLVPFKQ